MNSRLDFEFPTRPRGRTSEKAEAIYQRNVSRLRDWMRDYVRTLGFAPSSRGWCYALESAELITKGQFKKATKEIARLRKTGYIGFDLVADDENRALDGADIFDDCSTPRAHMEDWIRYALEQGKAYRPVSYWTHQRYYPIVMVEKVDLVSLFRPVLPRAVKIFNSRGWSDVNSRVRLVQEFQWAEEHDLEPVVLYCGDHDPAGLQISDTLKPTLEEISETLGWYGLDELRVIRFGLNQAQIEEGGLSWIDNLETSNGIDLADPKHPDHNKPYVRHYLHAYGARKVEANALIAKPNLGRSIMREAIWRWLDQDAVELWEDQNREASAEATVMADKITAWLGLLDASGLLYNPPKRLPAPDAMRMLLADDGEDD